MATYARNNVRSPSLHWRPYDTGEKVPGRGLWKRFVRVLDISKRRFSRWPSLLFEMRRRGAYADFPVRAAGS